MSYCEICDEPHATSQHKSLGQQILESAYANSQLPEEEQREVHFQGYYPNTGYFCKDPKAPETVSHYGIKSHMMFVNCKPCIEVAKEEIGKIRESCYCDNCRKNKEIRKS